jgi:hypothetical protein
MTVRFSGDGSVLRAKGSRHFAARQEHGGWRVSWLWDRQFTRDQATTAMVLAGVVASAPRWDDSVWLAVENWAGELGLRTAVAVALALRAPERPARAGERCECGSDARRVFVTVAGEVPWCGFAARGVEEVRDAAERGRSLHGAVTVSTFEAARSEAHRLLGDAADWLRGWGGLTDRQREGVRAAFRGIEAAKSGLDEAAAR